MNEDINDPWGEPNLHDALRFLALEHTAKCRYLPGLFEPRTFHLRFSDHVTGNPLNFMTAFADDLCQRDTDDPESRLWLTRLSGVLASLDYSDSSHYWLARNYWESPESAYNACFGLWDALQHLSKHTLRAFQQPSQSPHRSCIELLCSFSDSDDLKQTP